ncbi:MAG: sigma-70 family RNA polymerase sigma factor [Acidimicrobiales bacterium]
MLTDAELVDGVVAGYDDAFAQLYERHSSAAWRLGQTVTGNADDAADAVSEAFAKVLVAVRAGQLANGGSFRSYLLTATRNAALDNIRKTSRARPTEADTMAEFESASPTPPERLTGDEEAALVAEAFRDLPERWRSVLWLTEVEGVATKDAARQLHLSPNGAAQLAVRARTGLRDRFLQAHLRKTVDPLCQATVERLGAYVGGGLAPRELAKVDQHLAGCRTCEARRRELEDVGTSLRRALLPVPVVMAGAAGAAATPAAVGGKVATALAWAHQAWVAKAAAGVAAGVLAVGAGGAMMSGPGADRPASVASAAAGPAEEAMRPPPAPALARSEPVGPSTSEADPSTPPAPAPAEGATGPSEPAEAPCGDTSVVTDGLDGSVTVAGRHGAASLQGGADRSRAEGSLTVEPEGAEEPVKVFAALVDHGSAKSRTGESTTDRSAKLEMALGDHGMRIAIGGDGAPTPVAAAEPTAPAECPANTVTIATPGSPTIEARGG